MNAVARVYRFNPSPLIRAIGTLVAFNEWRSKTIHISQKGDNTMFTSKPILTAALSVATFVVGFAVPDVAEANHKYRYTGTCYNFHGEEHLIHALNHMDNAVLADCHRDRVLETVYAKREVMTAYREFCCPKAKANLLIAARSLNRYLGTRAACDLNTASDHILAALGNEKAVHVRAQPAPVYRSHRPVYRSPAIECGPSGCYTRPSHHSHRDNTTIRLNGRQFSIGFSF